MKRALVLAVIGVVAGIGAGVHAWGAGAFWPCEALGGMASAGRCTPILALDGRSLNGMDRLPDGNILAAARGAGTDPDTPVTLIEIDPEARQIVAETPLSEGIAANASVARIAVNGDGSRVALTGLRMPTTIVDREGRVERVFEHGLVAFMGFDAEGRLALEMGHNSTGIPDADRTQLFDGDEPQTLAGAPPARMFASGVQTVLSDDGRLYAQGMEAPESGLAAIRIGPADSRDAAGMLLAGQLRAGCSYSLPRLAFSPDGGKLAATFWCPDRWGTQSAALLVWDVTTGHTLARIPTHHGWSQPFWMDDTALLVSRYDPGRQRAELFEIRLDSGR